MNQAGEDKDSVKATPGLWNSDIQNVLLVDGLTNLPNLQQCSDYLARCVQQERNSGDCLVLMILDLDDFKNINHTYSHTVGDEVLVTISQRMRNHLPEDAFLARVGNDEFAVVWYRNITSCTDLGHIAQPVLDVVREPLQVSGRTIHVAASAGLAIQSDARTQHNLFTNADIALYAAKSNGGKQWKVYEPTLDIETYRQFMLKNDLPRAIEDEQFVVHYQPKVDPVFNRLVGAEALVRWHHEDWGLLGPRDFISLAEENSLLPAIEHWVFKTVCAQNMEWQDAGLRPIPISVNVSAKHLLQPGFVQEIRSILRDTGLEGRWLEIEITEHTMLYNERAAKKVINDLRILDVHVSVDDFGTGYSSLSLLKRYKFDSVKIDKTFVDDVNTNIDSENLLQAMIQMIHAVGIKVVVEGAETSQQVLFLRENDCDEVQGFFYSPPIPAQNFAKILQQKILMMDHEENTVFRDRRKFYRIDMQYPLVIEATIDSINGSKVHIGATDVLVSNIGPGGLRFLSNLRLPVNSEFLLKFTVTTPAEITVFGHVVWVNGREADMYEYGVQFVIEESLRAQLTEKLNHFANRLKKRQLTTDIPMYMDNPKKFFAQSDMKNVDL